MLSCSNQALRLWKNDYNLLQQPKCHDLENMKEALFLGGPPTKSWLEHGLQCWKMPEEERQGLIERFGRHNVWGDLKETRFDGDVRQAKRLVLWKDDGSLLSLISAMIRGKPKDRVPCRTLLFEHSVFGREPCPDYLKGQVSTMQ